MNLGLVHDPVFQEHDAGHFHCESPQRLMAIHEALMGWTGLGNTQRLPLRLATDAELLRVHHESHLNRIAHTEGKHMALDADTGASPRSHEVARLAAGSLVDLCRRVKRGELIGGAALLRPPGHHATRNRAMGFCLFNNVAVAAADLIETMGLERVLIVDWDVHHGNGTEDIFFNDNRVLYFSLHQFPLYPGTGAMNAVGREEGEGYTINLPLPAGLGDLEYIRAMEDLLFPIALEYNPQFILISGGFDAHREDPLGGMLLTSNGFGALTQIVMELAARCCPGKVVMALEGGYAVRAIARCVVKVMDAMVGGTHDELRAKARETERPKNLRLAMESLGYYWPLLRKYQLGECLPN